MFRIFWVHNCFLTATVKTINSSPATNIATLSQTIAFSSLTAAFPRLRVCNVYIHPLTATNEHWIREYQLKHVPDYQWKLPDSKWDCCTLLSESFPIDLLAVNCIQKKKACCCRCCCMLKEKVFRVQRILSKVEMLSRQPFVRWQLLLNILTKTSWHCLSFREIKMELHLLCVSFPHYSFLPWSMAWGGALISSLSVRVGRWVVFRWSVPACAAAFVSSVSCLNGKSQCGLPDSSAVGCLVASLPGSWATHSWVKFQWKRSQALTVKRLSEKMTL